MSLRLLVLLVPLPLAACLSAGNTEGDFACKAPGGTCAPMTLIDGQAVAGLGAGRGVVPMGRGLGASPAAPAPLRTVAAAAGPANEDSPPRTSERVLRVVFPAHIDPDGVYREESAAHAVIEPTAWAAALGGPALEPRRVPALRPAGVLPAATGGAAAAAAARSVLASMDEVVALEAARRTPASLAAGAPASGTAAPAELPPPLAPQAKAPTPVTLPSSGAVVSSFLGPSRSVAPMSLAEAAASMAAPPIARLDPRGPGNYDTPDIVAAVTPAPGASASDAPGGAPAAPPMRTVRWKGKLYRVPARQRSAFASEAMATKPSTPPAPTTADLNRRSLLRAASPSAADDAGGPAEPTVSAAPPSLAPRHVPTTNPATAAARARAMAAPQLEVLASQKDVIDPAAVDAGGGPMAKEPRP